VYNLECSTCDLCTAVINASEPKYHPTIYNGRSNISAKLHYLIANC